MSEAVMDVPNLLFVGGEWCEASDGGRLDVVDPATEEVVDTVPRATTSDLDRALAAAAGGFARWREADAWTRSAVLRSAATLVRERADDVAAVLTQEQGKPLAESRAEVAAAADQFDWFADEARRIYGRVVDGHSRAHRILVLRQPVGPVAAFTPWNFPALLPARKLAPAVAAGCSIILKPAEEAPRTALCLAAALAEAGVPPGVVNVITGEPAEISTRLVHSDVIRKVTLTGSVPVGRELARMAGERIKPISLELGGHAPVLVFPDADVVAAAEVCARGKFRNAGQVCISASRFLVHDAIQAEFTAHFTDVARGLRVGPGADPASDVGPLSNARRRDAVEALVSDAVGKGAAVLTGGGRPAGFDRGFFFEPTVLGNVDLSMDVMTTEPFGPLAPVAPFDSLEHALELANATSYGLSGYVFTRDTRTAFLAAEGLDVGMVGVNNLVIATAEAPFGGVKLSGSGREGGTEGIEEYVESKYVNLAL